MRIVITGGLGFLGRLLARQLVDARHEVIVVDRPEPAGEAGIASLRGDVTDAALLARAIKPGTGAVVHLASMVSAGCEEDFDAALRVNLDGTRAVLEAARAAGPGVRFVFASSVATFGGAELGGDDVKQAPVTTYGMTKTIGELLVNDYTRKGFVDGRTARLPTVIVRPGVPNAAASSFCSGVFREPLAGLPSVVPVSASTPVALIGYRSAVSGLAALIALDGAALGNQRAVGLPALEVDVAEMIAALRRVGASRRLPLGNVSIKPDPAVEAIVATWPGRWDNSRAQDLGLPADRSLDAVIDEYLDDQLS